MKKTYINPTMKVVELKYQHFLAASLPTNSTPVDPSLSDAPEFDFDDFDE